jgi:uncharacterized protein (TIGR03437 family)
MKKVLVLLLSLCFSAAALAAPQNEKAIRKAGKPIHGQYIVVFNDKVVDDTDEVADELISRGRGQKMHVYKNAMRGFAARMNPRMAEELLSDPRVSYIEEDSIIELTATQSSATWGLDRIDQRSLPLSGTYTYDTTASNVTAYVIDTGVLATHNDFGGRVRSGYTAINDGRGTTDCNGHGTHVAGTVGGSNWGVAKGVKLVAVRVLDCNGSGTNSGVIAGVDWVASDHAAGTPAVANMSLGGGASTALDDAIRRAHNDGVTMVVASGNENVDACNSSPARVAEAITVNSSTSSDARSSFSNWGTCTDIFAPGSSITSAWYTSTTATNTISGTSMASPHVAGAAALYLASNTSASPASVWNAIKSAATPSKITSAGSGSPNLLLYNVFGTPTGSAPTISSFSPGSGAVGTSVTISGANFTGASAVRFNGTSAGFSVNSASQITATVPSGATTGPISVVNAYGTATSAGTFTVTTSSSSQLLANPGFESGNVSWTTTSGVITNSTSRTAQAGSWYAWMCGYGSTTTDYAYQQITIPSTATSATLNFYLKIDSAETTTTTAYDKLSVQVLNSSGTVLATLGTYSNLNKSTAYSLKSFSLNAYRGQTIRVRFYGTEDSSLQTSFLVDSTSVNVQ